MTNGNGLASVDHVVVLMLGNRSFDHMLGFLYPGNVSPSGQPFDGLTGTESNPGSDGKYGSDAGPAAAGQAAGGQGYVTNFAYTLGGYPVCDRWFSSVPTETLPNRAFACAATSQGHMDDKTHTFSSPTIFGLLDAARQR